ncbi:MAG: hypothetical protein LUG26_01495, partial [Ruminococcus sp.]|nr:hypothetical protein [Ruminococcus sp.]
MKNFILKTPFADFTAASYAEATFHNVILAYFNKNVNNFMKLNDFFMPFYSAKTLTELKKSGTIFSIGNAAQSTPDGFAAHLLLSFPSSCTKTPC